MLKPFNFCFLLEVHTFSHWFGTFITFTGWGGLCVLRQKVPLLLMRNVL